LFDTDIVSHIDRLSKEIVVLYLFGVWVKTQLGKQMVQEGGNLKVRIYPLWQE